MGCVGVGYVGVGYVMEWVTLSEVRGVRLRDGSELVFGSNLSCCREAECPMSLLQSLTCCHGLNPTLRTCLCRQVECLMSLLETVRARNQTMMGGAGPSGQAGLRSVGEAAAAGAGGVAASGFCGSKNFGTRTRTILQGQGEAESATGESASCCS